MRRRSDMLTATRPDLPLLLLPMIGCGAGPRIPAQHRLLTRAVLILLLIMPAAGAAPSSYTLTGDGYVKMMLRPEPMDAYDYLQRDKAYSYLDGVRDSAEGRVWCDMYTAKTPDLAYEIAYAIEKLPAAERKRNASLLLLEQLKRMYPCRHAEGTGTRKAGNAR